jgi:aminopeptidase S
MGSSSRAAAAAAVRPITLVVALAAVLAGCTASAPVAPPERAPEIPLQRQLVAEVSGAGATPHLEALQRFADENGGHRASPSPGYETSVDYVAAVLRDAGYDVTTPTYPVVLDDGREINLRNVIAQTRTGNPDRVVMAGAHLDSVPEGPGINDNGSGVAALLVIARALGGSPPVTNAVRLGFWGSEEVDLKGSTHFVETLSSSDRQRLKLYINLDMLASPNAGYFVLGGGRDFVPSSSDPSGSVDVARVLADQLAATGVIAESAALGGGSDFEPFADAGIPTAAVQTGDTAEKSAAQAAKWGGQAGEDFDTCYHEECDRLDNLDRVALDRFSDAVAGAIAYFAVEAGPLPS